MNSGRTTLVHVILNRMLSVRLPRLPLRTETCRRTDMPYRNSETQIVVVKKRRNRFAAVLSDIYRWWCMSGTFRAELRATHLQFWWIEASPRRTMQHNVYLSKLQVFADWLVQQPDDEDLMIVESNGEIFVVPWYYVRVCQRRVSQLAAIHQRAWVEK